MSEERQRWDLTCMVAEEDCPPGKWRTCRRAIYYMIAAAGGVHRQVWRGIRYASRQSATEPVCDAYIDVEDKREE